MNPSQPEAAGIPLPPPPEQVPGPGQPAELAPAGPELASNLPAGPAAAMPSPLAPPLATTLPAAPAAGPSPTGTTNPATSLITDDDLIEKEWVNKAKQIVEQTRDDPYRQSENLTIFKADYLQKHYGKTVKISQ